MDGNLNTEYSVEYQYCPGCSGSRTARIKRDGDGEILSWYRYEEQGINTLRVDEKYDSDSDQYITADDQWRVQRYGKATKEIVLAYPHGETGIPSATDELVYATDRAGTVFHAFDNTGLLVYGSITEQDSFGAEMNGSWGHSSAVKHNWGCEYDSDVALYYFGGKRSWFSPERGMYLQHGSGYGMPGQNPNGATPPPERRPTPTPPPPFPDPYEPYKQCFNQYFATHYKQGWNTCGKLIANLVLSCALSPTLPAVGIGGVCFSVCEIVDILSVAEDAREACAGLLPVITPSPPTEQGPCLAPAPTPTPIQTAPCMGGVCPF